MNPSILRSGLSQVLLMAALACAGCDGQNRTLAGDLIVPPATATGDATPPLAPAPAEPLGTAQGGSSQDKPARSASDDWITTRSISALRAQPDLGAGIHVATHDGHVLLTGTVASAASRAQATNTVRAIDGVVRVDDQLTVH